MTEKQKILKEIEDIIFLLSRQELDRAEKENGWTDEIKKTWLGIIREIHKCIVENKPLSKKTGYFTLARGLDFYGVMKGGLFDRIVGLSSILNDYSKNKGKRFFLKLFGKK